KRATSPVVTEGRTPLFRNCRSCRSRPIHKRAARLSFKVSRSPAVVELRAPRTQSRGVVHSKRFEQRIVRARFSVTRRLRPVTLGSGTPLTASCDVIDV